MKFFTRISNLPTIKNISQKVYLHPTLEWTGRLKHSFVQTSLICIDNPKRIPKRLREYIEDSYLQHGVCSHILRPKATLRGKMDSSGANGRAFLSRAIKKGGNYQQLVVRPMKAL